MSETNLAGKVVLTTGSSSGIGAAIASEVAARGAKSLLVSRNSQKLRDVENAILRRGEIARAYVTDITVAKNCEELRAAVERDFGTPDIIINNAGSGRWAYLEDTSYAEIDEMIDAPYRAAVYLTRAFLPAMMSRGTGAIGNVSSIACFLPWPGATAYTAQRWAIRGFNEALRADLRGTKLSATLLACAAVDTEYFDKNKTRRPVTPGFIPVLKSRDVASRYLDAIAVGKSFLVMPFGMELLRRMSYWFPAFVAAQLEKAAGKPRTQSTSEMFVSPLRQEGRKSPDSTSEHRVYRSEK